MPFGTNGETGGEADYGSMMVELTRAEIDDLLREQVVGRVGCHDQGVTYVVPVIYAYDGEAFYVATVEGQKTRMMRASPSVCFEVDRYDGPAGWRSVIAQGVYEELAGAEAERAIDLLAARFGRSRGERRHGGGAAETVCFRIRVAELTGRARA
ncbi:MAG TPA: pyridoxamine 5'-phosphate oxidase family protein [Gaiellaceae bacterium]|nr:pyridoxamine 5'-phosphate oxidase family protein [Gaiellaceae bacterium]